GTPARTSRAGPRGGPRGALRRPAHHAVRRARGRRHHGRRPLDVRRREPRHALIHAGGALLHDSMGDESGGAGYIGAVVATKPDHAASLGEDDQPAEARTLAAAQCAVAACAELVSGKWTLLVIRDLADGPKS